MDVPTNKKHNGSIKTLMLIIAAAVVTAFGGFSVGRVGGTFDKIDDLSAWKNGAEIRLAADEKTANQVVTALQVLADHGSELSAIRNDVSQLRGVVEATRNELLDTIRFAAGDRFRLADWEREKELIEMRFETMASRLLDINTKLDQIIASK